MQLLRICMTEILGSDTFSSGRLSRFLIFEINFVRATPSFLAGGESLDTPKYRETQVLCGDPPPAESQLGGLPY